MPQQAPAAAGPDGYWSEDHPPSRGQYRTLAVLALELLGVPEPGSRLDASVAIARLRQSQRDVPAVAPLDDVPC